MRRAKIVCTLGPATSTYDHVLRLVQAGMDVARLNLSHGTHEVHAKAYDNVRRAANGTGRSVGILADLQGPKIRLGTFAHGPVMLTMGQHFTITTRPCEGTVEMCSTSYQGLPGDVRRGDLVLIDDGKVLLKVIEVGPTDVTTEVLVPGPVSDHKGLNLPGAEVSVPALSEKDTEDLRWALRQGVDFVALSFVRSPKDLDDVLAIMDEVGRRIPVIAKIEKPQAVDCIEEVIDAFDGIMVARGDLGVELPLEQVPLVQKRAVELARRAAKPVIVATQVLESMITAPRPTRAEASDAANAVLDGADALMLSGETSVGRYPIETVQTMARIIESTEEHGLERIAPLGTRPRSRGGAITYAAAAVGELMDVQYLAAFTTSGDSVRRMSRLRSRIPLLAFTPEQKVRSELSLCWGVETFLTPFAAHTDDMVAQVDRTLLESGRCRPGEDVIVVSGAPPGIPGTTNSLRIHRLGSVK